MNTAPSGTPPSTEHYRIVVEQHSIGKVIEQASEMAPTPFSQDPTRVMHVAVLSVFSFVALVAVVLRLWARKLNKNVWEANDYLVIVGLVGVARNPNTFVV